VQRTDESGRTYGEDPYGGVGWYPSYAHGYDYGGGATGTQSHAAVPDAAATAWDATHGDVDVLTATASDAPHGDVDVLTATAQGTPPGTAVTATAQDTPHGDVLTVPPPVPDTPGHPVPGPDAPEPEGESVRPVFVDSSGRRQRRVLRAARLLLIPAGCYVALLISAALGGPTLNAPFVPQPDPTHHPAKPHAAPSGSTPEARHSTGNTNPSTARKTSGSALRPTASATPAPTSAPTSAPAAAPTATTSPAPARAHAPATTPAPTPKGRAIGSSHKPVK
jgi:hypothetical protein